MRKILWMTGLFLNSFVFAQVSEEFNDGEMYHQPGWIGDTNRFYVNAQKQLQSSLYLKADTAHLSLQNPRNSNTLWEFYVQLNFDPSTSNQFRFYLCSNQADLTKDLDGYFVMIGETGANDGVDLYKQKGKTITKIIDGAQRARSSVDTLKLWIQVIHTNNGDWLLYSTKSKSTVWNFEGTNYDQSIANSNYSGVHIKHTSTRSDKFIFDNLFIGEFEKDLIAPSINELKILDRKSLCLTLSEKLHSNYVPKIHEVLLDGKIYPKEVVYSDSTQEVFIYFEDKFNVAEHRIEIPKLADTLENLQDSINILNFNYFPQYATKKFDVLINEIYADPSQSMGLPNAEFIEIYNNSNEVVNVLNWKIKDQSTTVKLPQKFIEPGEYLILCRKSDEVKFESFGHVLGLITWPSLNNSGDDIRIENEKAMLIDQIKYHTAWYKDNTKTQGGYTLERIEGMPLCDGLYSWNSSNNELGGSPGSKNSNIIDASIKKEFNISHILPKSSNCLKVFFNEIPDTNCLRNLRSIKLNGLSTCTRVIPTNEKFKEFEFMFNVPMFTSRKNTLQINDFYTATRSKLVQENFAFNYKSEDDTSKIRINEVLYDPFPAVGLPNGEFIELYNADDHNVSLNNWSIQIDNERYFFESLLIEKNQYLILCNREDSIAFTKYGKVYPFDNFPNLLNSSSSISLYNVVNRLIDTIKYSNDWQSSNIKKQGGWSLELIDPRSVCRGINSWASSINSAGGTPGIDNSIRQDRTDTIKLNILSIKVKSFSSIEIQFNKNVRADLINPAQFYLVDPMMRLFFPVTVVIDSPYYKNVSLDFGISLPLTTYELVCHSIPYCANKDTNIFRKFRMNYVEHEADEIYFSELFIDPAPSLGSRESEFIELYYSGTDTLNDVELSISNTTSTNTFIIPKLIPKSYYILIDKEDAELWVGIERVIQIDNFIGLRNTDNRLIIKNKSSKVLDSMQYDLSTIQGILPTDGRSYEKINGVWTCQGESFWITSREILGSSPGEACKISKNDVGNDWIKESSYSSDDNSVHIKFNQSIHNKKMVLKYADSGKEIEFDGSKNELMMKIDQSHIHNNMVHVNVKLVDCSQTLLDSTLSIFIPTEIKPGMLQINEILFNPYPESIDFIELYNNSENIIRLNDFMYGNAMSISDKEARTSFTEKELLLNPHSYYVLCIDKSKIYNFYKVSDTSKLIQVESMPSMNDESGSFILYYKNEVYDRVDYTEDQHISWYDDNEGRSLERKSPNFASDDKSNWASASDDIGKASPTLRNSQYIEKNNQESEFELRTKVIHPQSDGLNEELEILYNVGSSNTFIKLSLFDENGRFVGTIINGRNIIQEGLISCDIGRDQRVLENGIYILVIEAKSENGAYKHLKLPFAILKDK